MYKPQIEEGMQVKVLKDGRKFMPGCYAKHNVVGKEGKVWTRTHCFAHVRLDGPGSRVVKVSLKNLERV